MKRNDPTYKEMISRIASGELTRAQAAETYGVKLVTLNAWIVRSKETLPDRRFTNEVRKAQAERLGFQPLTDDRRKAMNEAVQRVIAGEISCQKAAAEIGVSRTYLTDSVRREKTKLGVYSAFRRTAQ